MMWLSNRIEYVWNGLDTSNLPELWSRQSSVNQAEDHEEGKENAGQIMLRICVEQRFQNMTIVTL